MFTRDSLNTISISYFYIPSKYLWKETSFSPRNFQEVLNDISLVLHAYLPGSTCIYPWFYMHISLVLHAYLPGSTCISHWFYMHISLVLHAHLTGSTCIYPGPIYLNPIYLNPFLSGYHLCNDFVTQCWMLNINSESPSFLQKTHLQCFWSICFNILRGRISTRALIFFQLVSLQTWQSTTDSRPVW